MSAKFKVSRRSFLQAAGVGTGAMVFGSYLTPALQAQGLINNLINGFPVDGIPVVALGPSTESEARAAGLEVVAVAGRHDLDGLIDAVASLS